MVQIEDNDKFLREFLAAGKPEVPDDGFSKRVMRRLPERSAHDRWRSLNRLLTLLVTVLSVTLFYLLGGFQAMGNTLKGVGSNILNHDVLSLDPNVMVVVALVLLLLLGRKIVSLA
ncbi:MAG: DUF5056 domain-containing protein [Mediterranea sp.]|jgi:hypothetical protein|nr:DUF5056 domain-containing protein [Mediterranea sp.]